MSNTVEYRFLKPIKQKLKENNLTITRADKGKTMVIIENTELHNKIMEFNVENGLKEITKDPAAKNQKDVK
jgi:hypothetical protein